MGTTVGFHSLTFSSNASMAFSETARRIINESISSSGAFETCPPSPPQTWRFFSPARRRPDASRSLLRQFFQLAESRPRTCKRRNMRARCQAFGESKEHCSPTSFTWRVESIYRCFALDKVGSTASNKTHNVMKMTVKNLLVAPAALVRRTAIEDEIQLSGDPSSEPSNCEADAPAAKSPSRSE